MEGLHVHPTARAYGCPCFHWNTRGENWSAPFSSRAANKRRLSKLTETMSPEQWRQREFKVRGDEPPNGVGCGRGGGVL